MLESLKTLISNWPINIVNNTLPVLSCLAVLGAILLGYFINKKFPAIFSKSIYVLFIMFCFFSLILGDVKDFYGKFVYWDNFLHFSSGVLLSILGFILTKYFNKSNYYTLNPIYVLTFSFCFVMTIESLWEIVEYWSDDLLKTNMQTYMISTSSFSNNKDIPLVGHMALKDTMYDFMCNAIGGIMGIIIGYKKIMKKNT